VLVPQSQRSITSGSEDLKEGSIARLTSVQITTFDHYMKLQEGINRKVSYEMDQGVRESGVLVQRLVAVNSVGGFKHITVCEIPVREGANIEMAFNLLSNKRLLIHSELNSHNA